jgi:hypothetical protein
MALPVVARQDCPLGGLYHDLHIRAFRTDSTIRSVLVPTYLTTFYNNNFEISPLAAATDRRRFYLNYF